MKHEATYDRVARTVRQRNLAPADAPVLLMVSGGSDSTALAYMAHDLHTAGQLGPLAVLHVNHHLRGEASDGDAAFVARLAEALGLPLFNCDIDVAGLVEATGGNTEAIARQERYAAAHEAFRSLCAHVGAPTSAGRIFTAHTQDDRVENFYMRSIVGTGPGGFRSMRYVNGQVARPCMDVSRIALQDYIRRRAMDARADSGATVCVADEAGNLWRTDATNAHTDRFRAYVRAHVVPAARERNPQLLNTLCRSMNLIADEDDYLEEQARELAARETNWLVITGETPDYAQGCKLSPTFGGAHVVLQRRVVANLLAYMLGPDARIETASVEAVCNAFAHGAPVSGYVANVQGDLAISANKRGVRIEPMAAFRARRNRL